MRIALFDSITERHVGASLARALRVRGHTVHETGEVWRGHRLPGPEAQREHVEPAVDAVLERRPDAVLCLRPSALPPALVARIAATGATTLAWLCDDPVLYEVTYRHVVEAYDVVLHGGPAAALPFYEARHGVAGVSFPFWTDDVAFAYHPRAETEYDAVFLGHVAGHVRRWRYAALAALPFDVRVHGQALDDPAGIVHGQLAEEEIPPALRGAAVALSIPQRFADYAGHEYDFPELAGFGSFALPSRVVQCAALGLPVVSLDPGGPSAALPEIRAAADHDALVAEVRALLADPAARRELGRATRGRFERRLSAESRAALLERLLADDGWRGRPAAARAALWREHDPADEPPAAPAAPAPDARPAVVVTGFYGAGNVGDELILQAVAGRLDAAGARVVVAAQRPEAVARRHRLEAFSRLDLEETEARVGEAAAVVVGGGGLFHDYSFARAGGLAGVFRRPGMSVGSWAPPMVMAAALERPVHLYGLGLGPLTDPDARRLAGWLAAHATSVSVRDAASRELLRELPGAPAEVGQVADPVYALDLGDQGLPPGLARMAASGGLVALVVRPWADPAMDGLDERLGQALTGLARRHDIAVLGLTFQPDHDEPALAAVMRHLRADVPRLTVPWTGDAAALAGILRGCAAVVSMRLHGALLAHRVGTPCVGLAYDPKVAAHFAEVGRADACLGLDVPRPRLTDALERALAEPRDTWAERVAALEDDARRGLDALAARVEPALAAPAR